MTQARRLASRISGLEADRSRRSPQLAHSSLEDGALREFNLEGTQVAQYGKQYDGTSTAAVLVSPEPPAPSAPTVVGVGGGVKVSWDGTFEGDETVVAPMDWRQVDVVVGPVGMDPIATPPSVAITSPRGGVHFVACPPGEYAVALVSRALSGRPSAPSLVVTATAFPLVDSAQFDQALEDLTAAQGRLDTAEADINASEAEIVAAKIRLADAEQDVIDALAASAAAQNAADAKTTVYRQSSAPAGTFAINDLWLDTDDGLLYTATTTAGGWTLHSDQRIAAVVTSNATKTTLFSQISAPSTTGRTVGDMWIDTDDGNKIYDWVTATGWTARVLGDSALAALDLAKLVVTGTTDLNVAVAQHIAGKTAAFQQVDASNITVTGTSNLSAVVAERLSVKIAEFIQITAQNITVDALDGRTIRGVDIIGGSFITGTGTVGEARWELRGDATARTLHAYSGLPDETAPGGISSRAAVTAPEGWLGEVGGISLVAPTDSEFPGRAPELKLVAGGSVWNPNGTAGGGVWPMAELKADVVEVHSTRHAQIFVNDEASSDFHAWLSMTDYGEAALSSKGEASINAGYRAAAGRGSFVLAKDAGVIASAAVDRTVRLQVGGSESSPSAELAVDSLGVTVKGSLAVPRAGIDVAYDAGVGGDLTVGGRATVGDGQIQLGNGAVKADAMTPSVTPYVSFNINVATTAAEQTNAVVAFKAPPSGRGAVTVTGFVRTLSGNGQAFVSYRIREGATAGAGTIVVNQPSGSPFGNYNPNFVAGSTRTFVSGLIPGNWYHLVLVATCAAGGMSTSGVGVSFEPGM